MPTQDFIDVDALCLKRFPQHRNTIVRLGGAAHEYVERGVTRLRPGVDGDVALGQHRDAGNPIRLEMVHMDVQERRACRINAAAQRRLDEIDIVEALRPIQIDNEVHAGAANAVADCKMILACEFLPAFHRGDDSAYGAVIMTAAITFLC